MKNIENKMIAIDKEKENIFFFEFIPSISKAFVEFSTDEDLFEQFKSYPINQIPEQTKKWSEVEEEEFPFIHTTCNKYLDEYVKTTAYTHLQDSMIMSFAVLWDALYKEVDKKRIEKKYALIDEKAKTIALFERWDASKKYYCEFSSNPAFLQYLHYSFSSIPKEKLKNYSELDIKTVTACFDAYLDNVQTEVMKLENEIQEFIIC